MLIQKINHIQIKITQATISLCSIVAWLPAISYTPCHPLYLCPRPQPVCTGRPSAAIACAWRPTLTRPSVHVSHDRGHIHWWIIIYRQATDNFTVDKNTVDWRGIKKSTAYFSNDTWKAFALLSSLRILSLSCISLCRFNCRSRIVILSNLCDRRFFQVVSCQCSYINRWCLNATHHSNPFYSCFQANLV